MDRIRTERRLYSRPLLTTGCAVPRDDRDLEYPLSRIHQVGCSGFDGVVDPAGPAAGLAGLEAHAGYPVPGDVHAHRARQRVAADRGGHSPRLFGDPIPEPTYRGGPTAVQLTGPQ